MNKIDKLQLIRSTGVIAISFLHEQLLRAIKENL